MEKVNVFRSHAKHVYSNTNDEVMECLFGGYEHRYELSHNITVIVYVANG